MQTQPVTANASPTAPLSLRPVTNVPAQPDNAKRRLQTSAPSASAATDGESEDVVTAFLNDRIDWTSIVQSLRTDSLARARLVDRFTNEHDAGRRRRLRRLLRTIGTSEVATLALQLANSTDPIRRGEGLDLLTGPAGEAVGGWAYLRNALRMEEDPATLSVVISRLQPSSMPPAEQMEVANRLRLLARSDDPAIRARGVAMLPQWDKSPAAEEPLYQALADQAQNVRTSALEAIVAANLHSQRLKSRLLGILSDEREDDSSRILAKMLLQKYALSDQEYEAINRTDTAFSRPRKFPQ